MKFHALALKPYMVVGGKSVGEQVIDDLRLYIPEYKKTQLGIYKNSVEQGLLRGAIANSKRIFLDAEKSLNYNPSTNVDVLMEYLEKLKD